ncbi:hypothetical protein OC846_005920 [Tilletia horrida]|uniref:Exonuclease 1 n=1 Tax=Tilletia horrida TaxID=155126 RepID=A0AAN6GML1_9BASI|nr:hypothetical protein OC846_005920 [Tilletia horrida]
MGIQGLLPLLKDIQNPTHLKEYKGKTIGVDAYVWLHRGAFTCAQELVLGQPTDRFVRYAMHKIRMMKHFGVTPYLVFDGDKLPSKIGTEQDREKRRSEYKAKAQEFLRAGDKAQARDLYGKCVDVTPAMAYQLILALRRENVPYIVAPYEADAQLAFLEKEQIIDAILTEDSDMLVFGCQTVLFKLDSDGNCIEIRQSRFTANKTVSFVGWTIQDFRHMSILSGCDYLDSIIGMGLKNAHRLLRKHKSVDKVLQAVRLEGKMRVPPDYARNFRRAELTFLHQRVIDPRTRALTTLTPIPAGVDEMAMNFIGPSIPAEQVRGIATGELDPITRLPVADIMQGKHHNELAAKTSDTNGTPTQNNQSGLVQRGPFSSKSAPAGKTNLSDPSQPSVSSYFSTQAAAGPSKPKTVAIKKQPLSIAQAVQSATQPTTSTGPRNPLMLKDANQGSSSNPINVDEPVTARSRSMLGEGVMQRRGYFATQQIGIPKQTSVRQGQRSEMKGIDLERLRDTHTFLQLHGGLHTETTAQARRNADADMDALEVVSSAAGSSPIKPLSESNSPADQTLITFDFSRFRHGADSQWDCQDLSSNGSPSHRKRKRSATDAGQDDDDDIEESRSDAGVRRSPRTVMRDRTNTLTSEVARNHSTFSPTSNVTSSPASNQAIRHSTETEGSPTPFQRLRGTNVLEGNAFSAWAAEDTDADVTLVDKNKGKTRLLVTSTGADDVDDFHRWSQEAIGTPISFSQLHRDDSVQFGRDSPHESQLGDDWGLQVLGVATQGSVITDFSDESQVEDASSPDTSQDRTLLPMSRPGLERTTSRILKRTFDEFQDSGVDDIGGAGISYILKDEKAVNGPVAELAFTSQASMVPFTRAMGELKTPAKFNRHSSSDQQLQPVRPIVRSLSRSNKEGSLKSIGQQARRQPQHQPLRTPAFSRMTSAAEARLGAMSEPKRPKLDMLSTQTPLQQKQPGLRSLDLSHFRHDGH